MTKWEGNFSESYECFRLRFRGGVSKISSMTEGIKGGGGGGQEKIFNYNPRGVPSLLHILKYT